MFGGRNEVGIDGLHVARVRLAAPAHHEALDDGLGHVDLRLRHHRLPEAARRLRHERHRHDGDVGEVLAGGVVIDVEQRPQAPGRRQHRDGGLHVHPHITGVHRDRELLGRRQPGVELVVHEQAPHVAEGDPTNQVLDVHPAVAQ